MKQLSVTKLSCPVLNTNSYCTAVNQVKISLQTVSKSSQPFCSNKGRSVLIASLYLSLKWTDCPSFNIFSISGRLVWSARKKGNTEKATNAANGPNLSNCLWNCCRDGHRSARPRDVSVECKVNMANLVPLPPRCTQGQKLFKQP